MSLKHVFTYLPQCRQLLGLDDTSRKYTLKENMYIIFKMNDQIKRVGLITKLNGACITVANVSIIAGIDKSVFMYNLQRDIANPNLLAVPLQQVLCKCSVFCSEDTRPSFLNQFAFCYHYCD